MSEITGAIQSPPVAKKEFRSGGITQTTAILTGPTMPSVVAK